MGKSQRVFVIVLDSLGFGAMPDAEQYGDSNVDTIGHIAEKMQLHIPNLQKLGAANIRPINGVASVTEPLAKVTKLCEKSHGKDTMTGHWEMMGLDTLYHYCEIARKLTMRDEWKVGRVIARPYVGKKRGEFVRTSNRHDYALKPFGRTALNALKDAGLDVISVGKIFDIFDGEGLTESNKSKSSVHGMEQTIDIAKRNFKGLCFTNLVDFDALWGHRRNPIGYGEEIERFDKKLGELLDVLREDDLVILTADHGNDPTYTGTDHTREKVPFIAYSPSMRQGGNLPEQQTFAVIGATIADNFGVEMPEGTIGHSILQIL